MKDFSNNKKNESFFVLIGRFTSRRNFKKSDKYLFYSLFFVFVFLGDLSNLKFLIFFKDHLSTMAIPIKQFANDIVEIPKLISTYVDIKNDNKRLQMELDDLKIKTITAKGTERELEELKKTVNLKYSISSFKSVEKVLGFDKGMFDSFLIISATQKETKPGGIVISSDGLIGTIFDVFGKVARVMTISDHRLFIPVRSQSGEHMIISGFGDQGLISKEVRGTSNTSKIDLNIGDILYTSGEGGIFHSNIPVAKVLKIDNDKEEVVAEPIATLQNISFVWIFDPIVG